MRIFTFGDFRLETEDRKLFRLTGETVPLTPRVFNLLLALVENRERVLTKEELLETVWADCVVEESNLSQSIFVLRKALGDSPHNPRFIRTIPAQGYRFIAATAVLETPREEAAETIGNVPTGNAQPAETARPSSKSETARAARVSVFRRNSRLVLTGIGALLSFISVSFTVSALTDFFSDAERESETIQTVQFFTPESKPEGEVKDISFSPDGKYLVFLVSNDGAGKIFVRASAGGGLVALTDGAAEDSSPVWSPDALRIAFLSDREGKTGIRTVSYLGGNSLFQTGLPPAEFARARLVKWSSDEKRIFFEAAGRLKAVELESGRIDEIKSTTVPDARNFKLSPDEKTLVFTSFENGREQIWAQTLTGSAAAFKLTDNNYRNLSPDWFPDSRRIAFSSNRNGDFQIYVVGVAGEKPNQLTFNRQHSYFPVVSPDGTQIFYKPAANFDNN